MFINNLIVTIKEGDFTKHQRLIGMTERVIRFMTKVGIAANY